MRAAAWVMWKELQESLREPTVLLFSVGFPIVFYPLLIWGTLQLVMLEEGLFESAPPTVAVEGPAILVEAAEDAGLDVVDAGDAEAVAAGELDLFVRGTETDGRLEVELSHESTRNASLKALDRYEDALEDTELSLAEALAVGVGTTAEALAPPEVEEEDLAPPAEVTAFLLSRAVPAVMLVSLLLGAAYPAVEVVVGERERHTIETTLVAPVPRSAVLLGKLGAVLGIVLLATLGNMGSVLLTMLHIEASFSDDGVSGIALEAGQIALATPTLIATACLAVALMLLAALPATSFKQGQNMVSTVSTVGMAGAAVGVLPELQLDAFWAAVPFANAVLVLRDALAGELLVLPALEALAVNGVLATILLALATRVAGHETYLFGARLPAWLRLFRGRDSS